jgi:RsiW-degrading membrane proteinase PrsW (M82 family)
MVTFGRLTRLYLVLQLQLRCVKHAATGIVSASGAGSVTLTPKRPGERSVTMKVVGDAHRRRWISGTERGGRLLVNSHLPSVRPFFRYVRRHLPASSAIVSGRYTGVQRRASAAVSDPAQRSGRTRQTRALVNFLAPPSLAVLRVIRVEADASGARPPGEPPHALLSGGWASPIANTVVSLGRGLRNDAVLLDPAVSREHARLMRGPDGWRIENISSANPLWVEAEAVAPGVQATVPAGAPFQLGNTVLQLLAPPAIDGLDMALNGEHPAQSPGNVTGEMTALGLTGAHLLSPGVTLQYALRGRLGPRVLWTLFAALALLFAICAALTLGLAALVGRDALALGGAGRVLAAVTIPLIPAIGAAALVWRLDRYEREPPLLLLAAFLWGAVIAIPPVLFIERTLSDALLIPAIGVAGNTVAHAVAHALAQALTAGVTEEAIKGAGLLMLLLLLRDEFDNVTDGVVYGVLIGAGFAMVENFVYFALSSHADFGFLVVGRVLLGWLGHSTFTATFGAGLGYAREAHGRPGRRYRILAPLLGLLAALFLHTLFDFVAFAADAANHSAALGASGPWVAIFSALLDYLPLFAAQAILLGIVVRSLRRETAVIREYLADETLSGVVTPDEYILTQDARLRSTAERQYAIAYGARPWLTARALYQAEIGLAFRKWHVAQGDPPKRGPRQPEDAYRARIARLRRSLLRRIRPLAPPGSLDVVSIEPPAADSQPASS